MAPCPCAPQCVWERSRTVRWKVDELLWETYDFFSVKIHQYFSTFIWSSLRTPRFSRDLWIVSIFTLSYRGYLYAGMCSRYDLCRCWLDNWPIGRILSNARDGWKYFLGDLFFPRTIMVKELSLTKGQLYVLRENFALTRSKFGRIVWRIVWLIR